MMRITEVRSFKYSRRLDGYTNNVNGLVF